MDGCVSIQCAFAFQSIGRIFGFSAWFFDPKGILDANMKHGVLYHGSLGNRSADTEGGWLNETFGFPQPSFVPFIYVVEMGWLALQASFRQPIPCRQRRF